ncbi:MAG TPA: hypothetical protein VL332_01975 [Candidatus Saccharimonadaceae bacterium]|jgi:hypothetical protein|nr:hypothetical protein [Candidatus Saccharimonadaceae bacterium]
MQSTAKTTWRLRYIIALAALAIAGLLCMFVSTLPAPESFWNRALNSLAAALLIGGSWSCVYEFWLRHDFITMNDENTRRILDRLHLSDREEELGLSEAHIKSDNYDYSDLIGSARNLTILMNDGRTWVSVHNESLRKRLSDPGKRTRVFLLEPDSEMVAVMARKTGTSVDALQSKIRETVERLASLSGAGTTLEVRGHSLYNPYALFMGDEYAIMTPYFAAQARQSVPLFKFKNMAGDCLYKKLVFDMEALVLDSKMLLPAPPPAATGKVG